MPKTDPTETFVVDSGPRPAPDGIFIGRAVTDTVGFFGVTPVVQRAGAAGAAVGTTAATTTTPWGYGSSTQADKIVTLVNEIRAALVENGLMKGAA
jgi:hypothetical protein